METGKDQNESKTYKGFEPIVSTSGQPLPEAESAINREISKYNYAVTWSRWLISLALILGLGLLLSFLYKRPHIYIDLNARLKFEKMAVSSTGSMVALAYRDTTDTLLYKIIISRDSAEHFEELTDVSRLNGNIGLLGFSPDDEALFMGNASRLFYIPLNEDAQLSMNEPYAVNHPWKISEVVFDIRSGSVLIYGEEGPVTNLNYRLGTSDTIPKPAGLNLVSMDLDPGTGKMKAIAAVNLGRRRKILLEGDSLQDLFRKFDEGMSEYSSQNLPEKRIQESRNTKGRAKK